MSKRLIDANELISAMYYYEHNEGGLTAYDAQDIINKALTIEPKRGEWVKRTHDTLIAQVNFAYCSECGQPIMHEHTRSLWNFCPYCGADMRERKESE